MIEMITVETIGKDNTEKLFAVCLQEVVKQHGVDAIQSAFRRGIAKYNGLIVKRQSSKSEDTKKEVLQEKRNCARYILDQLESYKQIITI